MSAMRDRGQAIAKVEAMVFRAPVAAPVQTSFGTMHDRPMVLVRVTDADGACGWGEVWCNFPGCGAEHRARLVHTVLEPLLIGRSSEDPRGLWSDLMARTRVLAIQSGEPGPLAQGIAGIDIALWDLRARRQGMALWRLLGGEMPRIGLYASGINPTAPERVAAERRAAGYRAFKLKIGFDLDRDVRNVAAVRDAIGPDCGLMVDANQAWTLEDALRGAEALRGHRLDWIEEPLAADRPWAAWLQLARHAHTGLAAGENLSGEPAFAAAIGSGAVRVLQPDAAKWGGISGCLPVARAARARGLRYCPHYLGGGIGLLASAHLLAAVGGDGMLEVDANDNPLRQLLAPAIRPDAEGAAMLADDAGLGPAPDLSLLSEFAVSV